MKLTGLEAVIGARHAVMNEVVPTAAKAGGLTINEFARARTIALQPSHVGLSINRYDARQAATSPYLIRYLS